MMEMPERTRIWRVTKAQRKALESSEAREGSKVTLKSSRQTSGMFVRYVLPM